MQENNAASLPPATLMHRLDPRTKLAWLLVSFAIVLLPESPLVVSLGTLMVLAQITWARAWRELARLRWLLLSLAIFSIGLWSVLARGPTPLIGPVSRESLAFGAATFLKLAAMMAAGLTFLAATRVEELFRGLVKQDVRQGKVFELYLAGTTKAEAERLIPEIARRVLANPIIEKFDWEILRGR